jgi:hypothetical protein
MSSASTVSDTRRRRLLQSLTAGRAVLAATSAVASASREKCFSKAYQALLFQFRSRRKHDPAC